MEPGRAAQCPQPWSKSRRVLSDLIISKVKDAVGPMIRQMAVKLKAPWLESVFETRHQTAVSRIGARDARLCEVIRAAMSPGDQIKSPERTNSVARTKAIFVG